MMHDMAPMVSPMNYVDSGLRGRVRLAREFVWRGGVPGLLLLFGSIVAAVTTRQRAPGAYASVDASAMATIVYVSMIFLYSVFYIATVQGKAVKRILFRSPVCYLTIYTALCLASAAWSQNIVYTGYRAFECLAYLLLIASVVLNLRRSCTDQEMIDWIVLWGIWTLAWYPVARVRLVGFGYLASWDVFRSNFLSLGPLFFLAAFASRQKLAAFIIVIFCLLSTSNSVYFGIFFGSIPALAVGNMRARMLMLFLAGMFAIAALQFGGTEIIQRTLFHGRTGIGLDHASGRDTIFAYGLEQAMERPLLGYGFVTGETELINARWTGVMSFHNTFLSSWVGVGIFGPILLVCFFASLLMRILRSSHGRCFRHAALGSLIMIFLIGNSNPGLGGRVYGSWVPCLFVSLLISVLVLPSGWQRADYPCPPRLGGRPYPAMR